MRPSDCPSRQRLESFVQATLDREAADMVADHLDTCADCASTADQLTRRSDDLLLCRLREHPARLPHEEEPECLSAIQGVQTSLESLTRVESGTASPAHGAPRFVGIYEVVERLGQGGMGTVYQARHPHLDRMVALKILPEHRLRDEPSVERFQREMRALGRLAHPNIVMAHDAGQAEGVHFLVMEYIEGWDLSQLVRRVGALPQAEACDLVRQAALGLQYAHENGLVHRDIKPSNLMLTREGQVKILDLGLALLGDAPSAGGELTMNGQVMGTLDYMAPEQGMSSHDVDIRADIYSLGATLFKLLTGTAPFDDAKYDTPLKKLAAILSEEISPIRELSPDLPNELADVVQRMLQKQPERRLATPGEVAEALEPFARGADLEALVQRASSATVEQHDATEAFTHTRAAKQIAGIEGEGSAANTEALAASGSVDTAPQQDSRRDAVMPPVASPATSAAIQTGEATVMPSGPEAAPAFWKSGRMVMAAAAALAGFLVLGVILTITTKNGTVVVEGPDGERLPDDVTILLTGGGGELEISAKNQWTVRAGTDEFQVTVRDSQDRFTFEGDSLTVESFGRTMLKISRKPTTGIARASDAVDTPSAALNTARNTAAIPIKPALAPFDRLRREDIDPYELSVAGLGDPDRAPAELVAVYGDSRLRGWDGVSAKLVDNEKKVLLYSRGGGEQIVTLWDRETSTQLHLWRGQRFVLSADRTTAALLELDGTISVWNVASPEKTATIETAATLPLSVSPDGEFLAFRTEKGDVSLWRVGEEQPRFSAGSGGAAFVQQFFDTESTFLVVGNENATRVWDLATAESLQLELSGSPVAFRPHTGQLLVRSSPDTLKLYELPGGKVLHTFDVPPDHVPRFSPNGETLVVAYWKIKDKQRAFQLWDPARGVMRHEVEKTHLPTGRFAFLGGGERLMALAYSSISNVWDINTGNDLSNDLQINWAITHVADVLSGRRSAFLGHVHYGELAFYDFEKQTPPVPLEADVAPRIYSNAVSRDGRRFALGRYDEFTIVDLVSNDRITASTPRNAADPLVFSNDGKWIVILTPRAQTSIWDATSGDMVAELAVRAIAADFSPDGKLLALLEGNGQVTIWSVENREALAKYSIGDVGTTSIHFHPSDELLIVGREDQQIAIVEAKTGTQRAVFQSPTRQVVLSPKGDLLATWARYSSDITLIDTLRGEINSQIKGNAKATSMAFSPDGETLAVSYNSGEVWLRAVTTGEPERKLAIYPGFGYARHLRYAPDGRHLMTINSNGTVYVLRLEEANDAAKEAAVATNQAGSPFDQLSRDDIDPYELAVAGSGDPTGAPAELVGIYGDSRMREWEAVQSCQFSHEDSLLVSRSNRGIVRLWEIEEGRQVHMWPAGRDTLSLDGTRLAVSQPDGTLSVWDLNAGRELWSGKFGDSETICEFSAANKQVAVVESPWLRMLDAETGTQQRRFAIGQSAISLIRFQEKGRLLLGGKDAVSALDLETDKLDALELDGPWKAISRNGKYIVTKPTNESTTLWDAVAGKDMHSWESSQTRFFFNADTTMLVGHYPRAVWDVSSGKPLLPSDFPLPVVLDVSPDGKKLAARDDFYVSTCDLASGRQLFVGAIALRSGAISFSRGGKLLATAGCDRHSDFNYNEELFLREVDRATLPVVLPERSSGMVVRIAMATDGTSAVAFGDGSVEIAEGLFGSVRHHFSDLAAHRTHLTISPDGQNVISGHRMSGHKVELRDTSNGVLLHHFPGSNGGTNLAAFSPDSQQLAVAVNSDITLWDLTQQREAISQQEFRTALGERPAATSIAFSPDSSELVVARWRDNTIDILDSGKGELKRTFEQPGEILACFRTPDGGDCLAIGYGANITLHSLETGEHLHTLEQPGYWLSACASSPDGSVLATSPHDGQIWLWDSQTGELKQKLRIGPPTGAIRQLLYAPDGRHLMTVNGNGTVYVLRQSPTNRAH